MVSLIILLLYFPLSIPFHKLYGKIRKLYDRDFDSILYNTSSSIFSVTFIEFTEQALW